MKSLTVCVVWILILAAASPAGLARSLVESERAFAEAALASGVRTAFLRYMAEDGIVFRPGPVNGRSWYRDRPELDVTLQWRPTFAGASRDGDLGFTTGPWTLTRPEAESSPLHGHYISVWRSTSAGEWRVALDVGISHADPGTAGEPVYMPRGVTRGAETRSGDETELSAAEQTLCRTSRESGMVAAFRAAADEELRLYLPGSKPHMGRSAALEAAATLNSPGSCDPPTVRVSRSSDLGYAFAVGATGAGFVRIWRRGEAGWRVVVAVELAEPEPKEPS